MTFKGAFTHFINPTKFKNFSGGESCKLNLIILLYNLLLFLLFILYFTEVRKVIFVYISTQLKILNCKNFLLAIPILTNFRMSFVYGQLT